MTSQEKQDDKCYLKYLAQLTNHISGRSFPPNAHPSRLNLLLKKGNNSIGSAILPKARSDGLGLDNLPYDHKGKLMGTDSVVQFVLEPLKVKAPGATGLSQVRDVMYKRCRMCLWNGTEFIGNVLNVAVNQSKSSDSQWTFQKDCQIIVRCGDDKRYIERLHLYVEFNTAYHVDDKDFDGGLSKDDEYDCSQQVVEVTSCWSVISLSSLPGYFQASQVSNIECTNRMAKNHVFPLYAGELKLPPTNLEELLAVSQGKKGFFRQHFGRSSEFSVRLIPIEFASSLVQSRIEIRNLPVVCVLSHVMIFPVALYRQFVARELAKAQKPLAKLTHPVLTCLPQIMDDDDLRVSFLAEFLLMCQKRYKYVGSYPTREWLEPQFVSLVQDFWPLIRSESVMRKHIDNLKHYKDRKKQLIEEYAKSCCDGVGNVGGGLQKLSHDEEAIRVLMVKPFNIQELDFCLTNLMESAL